MIMIFSYLIFDNYSKLFDIFNKVKNRKYIYKK